MSEIIREAIDALRPHASRAERLAILERLEVAPPAPYVSVADLNRWMDESKSIEILDELGL